MYIKYSHCSDMLNLNSLSHLLVKSTQMPYIKRPMNTPVKLSILFEI